MHQLDEVAAGLDDVLEELREIARGLHPSILTEGGLRPALKTLARRSAVPVDLDIQVDRRLSEPVETAAYYTVAEALTNAAKSPPPDAADPGQQFGNAGAAPRAAPGPPALDRDVRPPG